MLLFTVSPFFLHSISSAQSVKIGIQAGTVLSQAVLKDDVGNKDRYDISVGGTAGLIFDFSIGKVLSIQPAVNYVQKGGKEVMYWKDYQTNETKKVKIGAFPQYIEMPINFIYNTRTNKGNFFYGLGPTFSFAVGGKKDTVEFNYSDYSTGSAKLKFGNTSQDEMRSFDFGANVLTGYESKSGFYLSLTYNVGLSNLLPKVDSNNEKEEYFARSTYVGFKIGWMVNRTNKK